MYERKPILEGVTPLAEVLTDFRLFRQIVTERDGSYLDKQGNNGHLFIATSGNPIDAGLSSIHYVGRRSISNCHMLCARPTEKALNAANTRCIDGVQSFHIIASPYWQDQGLALVVASDNHMIARPWVATVPYADLQAIRDAINNELNTLEKAA